MITIIVGSNRKGNLTSLIGELYLEKLKEKYQGEVKLLNIESMPSDVLSPDMYEVEHPWIENVKKEYIIPAEKFIFIIPEYNGTFPGSLKLFIDSLSSKDADKSFFDKKAALVGLSAGKFGNWLGLEHFGVVLNYLKVNVIHQKVSISNIWSYINDDKKYDDPKTVVYIEKQIESFINF